VLKPYYGGFVLQQTHGGRPPDQIILKTLKLLIRTTRLFWFDAMSINQKDPEERNNQIQVMDIIYQRARRVLIYLGEADDYSDSTMDAIAERKPSTSSMQKRILDLLNTGNGSVVSGYCRKWLWQTVL
jgi:hypothetical protein